MIVTILKMEGEMFWRNLIWEFVFCAAHDHDLVIKNLLVI